MHIRNVHISLFINEERSYRIHSSIKNNFFCYKTHYLIFDKNVNFRSFGDEVAEGKVERRGFKSSLLTTARGFGKRSGGIANNHISEER